MGSHLTFLSLIFISTILFSTSSLTSETSLHDEIMATDNALFSAFNKCDVKEIATFFSKDLEFYHDVSGLKGFDENMMATEELCSRDLGLKRTLVEDSIQIFPVKDFGAIQVGQHTFCHEVDGVDDCGTFNFTHIWKRTEAGWNLYRVVSYGH